MRKPGAHAERPGRCIIVKHTKYLFKGPGKACSVKWTGGLDRDISCAGTQKATFNGTGQPANGQTTSVYTLNFAGNCSAKTTLASKLPLTAQSA